MRQRIAAMFTAFRQLCRRAGLRRPKRRALLTGAMCVAIATTVFAAVVALQQAGSFQTLDLKARDFWIRAVEPATDYSDDIVVVEVGESEFKWLNRQDRMDRISDDTMAGVLQELLDLKPRVIGVDLFRDRAIEYSTRSESEPMKYGGSEKFSKLLMDRRIKTIMRIGLEEWSDEQKRTNPHPRLMAAPAKMQRQYIGISDALPDSDQVIRRAVLWLEDKRTPASTQSSEPMVRYSLAALLATEFVASVAADPAGEGAGAVVKPAEFNSLLPRLSDDGTAALFGPVSAPHRLPACTPTDGPYVREPLRGFMYHLDFRGGNPGTRNFTTFPISAVLERKIAPDQIKGKIVVLGQTAVSIQDVHNTPIMPKQQGVQIVAHQVDQLLRTYHGKARPVPPIDDRYEHLLTLGWTLFAGLLGVGVRNPLRLAIGVLAGLATIYLLARVLFVTQTLWIPVVAPMLSWFTCAAMITSYMAYRESQVRAVIRQLFDSHVDSKVVGKLMEDGEGLLQNGQLRTEEVVATVVFTDLVGFGKASEKFAAPELIKWLNEYMEPMSRVVLDHGGMINKYIGDAIMAVFGAPVSVGTAEDARAAVRCALAMRDKLKELNAAWEQRDIPTMKMRVGITTGMLVAGHLGSERRLEYTVLGDVVNKAARLEGVNKDVFPPDVAANGCRIFIGENTQQLLTDEFVTRLMDMSDMEFKAGETMINIYGVVGLRSDAGSQEPEPEVEPIRLGADKPMREAARVLDDDELEGLATDR